MLRVSVFFLSLLVLPAALAECIEVVDAGISIDEGDAGAGEVRWHALLKNRCERDQDAMLTVHFLNAGSESVYEVQDQVIVEREGEYRAGRKVYVPATYVGQVVDIDIQVEARERPF
jgi:hypothetical protein